MGFSRSLRILEARSSDALISRSFRCDAVLFVRRDTSSSSSGVFLMGGTSLSPSLLDDVEEDDFEESTDCAADEGELSPIAIVVVLPMVASIPAASSQTFRSASSSSSRARSWASSDDDSRR